MHLSSEYCEVHLDVNLAPCRWLFRSNEKVSVQFGVQLARQPAQGLIWVEVNDGAGGCRQQLVEAKSVGVYHVGEAGHAYEFFMATLPPLAQGGYHYRIGYYDREGKMHTCQQVRTVLVDEEAPRSIHEVKNSFLGIIDGKPLYGPPAQVSMTPSPQNWSQRLFYSLVIDRFAHKQKNDRLHLGWVKYDPISPVASHGGTLAGVIEKLPYLKALGVGVILLSPVYVNDVDGYHGYHPLHLMMVDPRLGTLTDLQALIAQAHALDMAVILDVVNNHLPNLIEWEEYGGPRGGEFKYTLGDKSAVLPYPIEARHTSLFHGPEYTDMINGRLFDFLEDWRTETPYVRDLLIQHLKYWIANTDIDGFRYDAVRHVGLDFWKPCLREIDRYARYLGKSHFLQIAEHAGYTHEDVAEYQQAHFTNFLDYPTYFMMQRALSEGIQLPLLADYCCGVITPQHTYYAGWQNNLMFLDNHDRTRMLHDIRQHYSDSTAAQSVLHLSLACLLLGPQPPVLYYGTEQEFDGALGRYYCEESKKWIGHDHYVREDMFANPICTWKFGHINRPTFAPYSTQHQTFQWIRQLATIRAEYNLLQSGRRVRLRATSDAVCALLITAADDSQALLLLLNLTDQSRHWQIPIPIWYRIFKHIEPLASTGGNLHLLQNHLMLSLPPFGVIVARLCSGKKGETHEH